MRVRGRARSRRYFPVAQLARDARTNTNVASLENVRRCPIHALVVRDAVCAVRHARLFSGIGTNTIRRIGGVIFCS